MSTLKSNESLISKSAISAHKSESSLGNGWQPDPNQKASNEPSLFKSASRPRIHSPARTMDERSRREENPYFGEHFGSNRESSSERSEDNMLKEGSGDRIVDYLLKMGKPLTVENWISLNYWNRTRESLEGEELAELEELIESNMLVDTDKGYVT